MISSGKTRGPYYIVNESVLLEIQVESAVVSKIQ